MSYQLSHACERMAAYADRGFLFVEESRDSADAHDDPDAVISYYAPFDEFSLLVRNGGTGHLEMLFCPFCGAQLPPSQRDAWFNKLERLGLDRDSEDMPPEMQDARWWQSGEAT